MMPIKVASTWLKNPNKVETGIFLPPVGEKIGY